jgi:hypothetical protein
MGRQTKFPADVSAMPAEELRALYARLLESRNGLQRNNAALTKWLSNINQSVTVLSCEGSLAFQAMAEKAGVRGHPSVSEAVRLFDAIAHPQWGDGKDAPSFEWPSDWDFDKADEWSGDADMSLNSPLATAIEFIGDIRSYLPDWARERGEEVCAAAQSALIGQIDETKMRAGFTPKRAHIPAQTHYRSMDRDQLIDLLGSVSWAALDLAQDMHFANNMLRRDLRAAAYRRICSDLYALCDMSMEPRCGSIDIKVMGGGMPF